MKAIALVVLLAAVAYAQKGGVHRRPSPLASILPKPASARIVPAIKAPPRIIAAKTIQRPIVQVKAPRRIQVKSHSRPQIRLAPRPAPRIIAAKTIQRPIVQVKAPRRIQVKSHSRPQIRLAPRPAPRIIAAKTIQRPIVQVKAPKRIHIKSHSRPQIRIAPRPKLLAAKTIHRPQIKIAHRPQIKIAHRPKLLAAKTIHRPQIKIAHRPQIKIAPRPKLLAAKTIHRPQIRIAQRPAIKVAHRPVPRKLVPAKTIQRVHVAPKPKLVVRPIARVAPIVQEKIQQVKLGVKGAPPKPTPAPAHELYKRPHVALRWNPHGSVGFDSSRGYDLSDHE